MSAGLRFGLTLYQILFMVNSVMVDLKITDESKYLCFEKVRKMKADLGKLYEE